MNGTCVCREGEFEGNFCEIRSHNETLGSITDANNPVGLIAVSVGAAAAVLTLGLFAYNKWVRKQSGLNAVPGVDNLRSKVVGDEYQSLQGENRYASNY